MPLFNLYHNSMKAHSHVGASITPDIWDRDILHKTTINTDNPPIVFVPYATGQKTGTEKGKGMKKKTSDSSRSWFCVLNNPQNLFGEGKTPEEMVEAAINLWCDGKPHRTCAINYEVGDSGTPHMHMVLEDPAKARFSALQKLFPSIHIEPTRGNKEQAEDYINKRGQFSEKSHTVIVPAVYRGQIKAAQGTRNDLAVIEELLEQGMRPNDIMDISLNYRKHEPLIKKAYFRKRDRETPIMRGVAVYWHVGDSGTGKSYTYTQLAKAHGVDNIYFMTDYENGGFDMYQGETILIMDEFKGNIRFQQLLNYLDGYKMQVHCRYANVNALWTEVHITSIYPPEEAYRFMVDKESQHRDTVKQLLRRIRKIVYHYTENGIYKQYEMDSKDYTDYAHLKEKALEDKGGFISLDDSEPLPFD